jgi:hypothetical protein
MHVSIEQLLVRKPSIKKINDLKLNAVLFAQLNVGLNLPFFGERVADNTIDAIPQVSINLLLAGSMSLSDVSRNKNVFTILHKVLICLADLFANGFREGRFARTRKTANDGEHLNLRYQYNRRRKTCQGHSARFFFISGNNPRNGLSPEKRSP